MRHRVRSEEEFLEKVVSDYHRQGYEVVVRPRPDDLPEFLRGLEPDLIASAPNENVVAEIKVSSALAGDKDLLPLAQAVAGRDKWRFELHVMRRGPSRLRVHEPQIIDVDALGLRLSSAELVRETLDYDSSLLLTWSTIEGLLRLVLQLEDSDVRRRSQEYLIKQSYALGFLTRTDLELAERTLVDRNRVSHGQRPVERDERTLDALRKLANRLLHDAQGMIQNM